MTKEKRNLILMAMVGSLALVALLLMASTATARLVPAEADAAQPHAVQAGGAWTSGWVPINQGQFRTFYHNLGGDPDDYVVELMFLDTGAGGMGINRAGYGGLEVNGMWFGAHWQNLTSNTIRVYRQPDDDAADLIRIWVWAQPSPPDYDSGWTDINPGQTLVFPHNLGVDPAGLTVGLWFSSTLRDIHHFAYGGLAVDGPARMLGAHWQNLTANSVTVIRHPNDTDVEQVRVVVVEGDPPAYDSLQALGGWQFVAQDTQFVFNHNLNWNPDLLLVRGECFDPPPGVRGIHQLFAGGNHDWIAGGRFQGAYMENLTRNTVATFREHDDEFCPQVRTRIWVRQAQVFLPIVHRSP